MRLLNNKAHLFGYLKGVCIPFFLVVNLFCLSIPTYAFTEKEVSLFNKYWGEANKLLGPYMFIDGVKSQNPTTISAKKALNESIKLFSKALEINPKSWQAYWMTGKAYQALGETESAYISFRTAYSIMPNNPDVLNEYLGEALATKRTEEAFNIAREGVKSFPKHVGLVANYAIALLLNQQIDMAYSVVEEAIKLDPQDHITKNVLELVKEVKSGKRQCPRSIYDLWTSSGDTRLNSPEK